MNKCTHPACLESEQLASACDFARTRRSGPGGQHRNKVESAVVVTHRKTGISGQASERRSQHENRTVAIQRLRLNLAVDFRSTTTGPEPSDLWRSRCHSKKISISQNHEDFPCILAEALDWIAQEHFQISAAATKLGCSTSQLIKLLKSDNSAFEMVNRQRKTLQMSPLK